MGAGSAGASSGAGQKAGSLSGAIGGIWGDCCGANGVQYDSTEWVLCFDDSAECCREGHRRSTRLMPTKGWWHAAANGACGMVGGTTVGPRSLRRPSNVGPQRLEDLTRQLFHLHDLNGDGVLEEAELIGLNEKIAMMHHGKDADRAAVRSKYEQLFRSKLDPNGRPVAYDKFRKYAYEVLDGIDRDPDAQELILEQFVAEAYSGRQALLWGTKATAVSPEARRPPQLSNPGQSWLVSAGHPFYVS